MATIEEGFKTKQLNIAAFLYASGLKLASTQRSKNEVFFEFTPKPKAQQLVETYFSGKASVDPRDLFARLNDLRDLIFQEVKNE